MPVSAGCSTYAFDLVGEHYGEAWDSAPMQSIAIKPGNTAGVAIKLDYVRSSSVPPNAEKAAIARWAPTTGGVDLYYDTHRDGVNATLIARGIFGTQFAWTLPNLAPNTYYLIARTEHKQSASLPFVVNTPPRVRILTPSYTTGPDYAATVVGNAWDMSDATDIETPYNVTGGTFKNGIFTAANTAPSGDPGLQLRVTAPIDPSRFYYLTYRMRVDGLIDILRGSVSSRAMVDRSRSDEDRQYNKGRCGVRGLAYCEF